MTLILEDVILKTEGVQEADEISSASNHIKVGRVGQVTYETIFNQLLGTPLYCPIIPYMYTLIT